MSPSADEIKELVSAAGAITSDPHYDSFVCETIEGLVKALESLTTTSDATPTEPEGERLMHLVIEEVDFESFYSAHGDPVSVHANEDAAKTVADRMRATSGGFYKVLPVKVA